MLLYIHILLKTNEKIFRLIFSKYIIVELKLVREKSNKEYTEGKLYINGTFFCDTLEDKDRGLY